MPSNLVIETIRSVIAAATPLVFAGIGETLTERAGIVNLSLDGSILLSAMVGFALAYVSGSLLVGFAAAMIVGALIALLVAYSSISLRQDQVAVGFVLTLLGADLSSFFGKPFVGIPGPNVGPLPIPVLSDIPVLGPILFDHNALVYLSFALIALTWIWMYRTQPGLALRAVGERPEAAYARGIDVNRMRYLYAALGGALVGLGGASYSLCVKLGWSQRHTSGLGWIALAIVIFGGWHPMRVALGAYLFGALKSLGSILQPVVPGVPTQVFQAAPFPLMILALLLVNADRSRLDRVLPRFARRWLDALTDPPPAALGQRFERS